MTCDLNIDDASRPVELESDDTLAVAPGAEVSVLHVPGPVSACEVWFDVPFDWLRGCVVRAYGVVGSVRVKLGEVDLKTLAPETEPFTTGTGAARGKGLCLTVQGRPASSYEVTAERIAGSPTTPGKFFARAWMGMDQNPAVATGTTRASRGARFGATSPEPVLTSDVADFSLAYLFQAGGRTRVEIDRIVVTYSSDTSGSWSIRGARLSAEAEDPGGDVDDDIEALDGSGTRSNAYLVHEAGENLPPRLTPDVFCAVVPGTGHGVFEWTAEASGGPIVLRPGRSEGFEVRSTTGADDARVTVAFYWREIEDPPVDLAHYGFEHEWRADEGVETVSGEVASWTDRLRGVVFESATNRPAVSTEDDKPVLVFVGANSERLDCDENLSLDAGGSPFHEYTIVVALKSLHTNIALNLNGAGSNLELQRVTEATWTHALQSSEADDAYVVDLSGDWTTVILRYASPGVMKTRSRGADGPDFTPSPALGALLFDAARLGARNTASSSSDFINMSLRHFAIAKRALTDDECVAVEGLMATYWNIR